MTQRASAEPVPLTGSTRTQSAECGRIVPTAQNERQELVERREKSRKRTVHAMPAVDGLASDGQVQPDSTWSRNERRSVREDVEVCGEEPVQTGRRGRRIRRFDSRLGLSSDADERNESNQPKDSHCDCVAAGSRGESERGRAERRDKDNSLAGRPAEPCARPCEFLFVRSVLDAKLSGPCSPSRTADWEGQRSAREEEVSPFPRHSISAEASSLCSLS